MNVCVCVCGVKAGFEPRVNFETATAVRKLVVLGEAAVWRKCRWDR